MPPKDSVEYSELWDAISDMKTALMEIRTLLIGQDGSGICARVKILEERPEKSRGLFFSALIAIICALIGTELFNYIVVNFGVKRKP